jgi:uncharacterized membrane protein
MKLDLKFISVVIMSVFYVSVGISHFTNPFLYLQIIPPVLPYKLALVYISGFFEILFGTMLIYKKTRFLAGWGLIILLVAVYPANIYLAQTNGVAMDISATIAWARLPIQFIFIGIAYWHSKIN